MHLLAPCTQTSPTQICIRLAPVVFLYLGWLCIQCKLYIKYIYIYNYIYIYKIHLNILNISTVIYISSIYTAFMLLPCCRLYNCLYALSHVHDTVQIITMKALTLYHTTQHLQVNRTRQASTQSLLIAYVN